MSAREKILSRIRGATGEGGVGFEELCADRPVGDRQLSVIEDAGAAFCRAAVQAGVEVHHCVDATSLPQRCADLLGSSEAMSFSPGQSLSALDWRNPTGIYQRSSSPIGVVEARLGIAETGTLCFDSRDVPSGLLFLADVLLVILDGRHLVARQEDAWQRLGPAGSALHLVTGPSRTADVEQTIQVGAHGPRRVVLFLVGPEMESLVARHRRSAPQIIQLAPIE